ncbi:MAG: carboxymuconolactone decarboxylase family protein [Planctomycetaceae bacterium]|nr:carboxymuconolactone decarboxylase family protein [Planctomycetaceae bacterium]
MTLTPLFPDEAPDKVAQTYERLRELFGEAEIPEMFLIYGNVEPFLRDFYMNFKKFVFSAGQLDERQKAAIALAVSAYAHCHRWTRWASSRCAILGFTEDQRAEILAIAATNAMYNTFFKFRDLSGSGLFEGMGVGLRAHTFSQVSLEEPLVELINIAISNLNACKPCTSGHVEQSRQLGLTNQQLLECVQCAATMYAGCQFLNAADC